MNMYLPIEISHDILVQCHGNYIKAKSISNMPEIDILRNFSQKYLVVQKDDFGGFGYLNDAQTPCWLRLYVISP